MLQASYAPRDPRVHVATTQAGVQRRRLLFLKAPREDADALLDLSASGMKILIRGEALSEGDTVEVDLRHPAMKGPVTLRAQVQWVRPEPTRAGVQGVGLHFVHMRDTSKVALERLLSLELGSSVLSELEGPLGFVARGASQVGLGDTFFVYDPQGEELGRVVEEPLFYRVNRSKLAEGQDVHRDFGSLQESLRWLFEAEVHLDIEPPLEPPPRNAG